MRLHFRLTAREHYAASILALAMMMAQLLLALPLVIAKVSGLWRVNAIGLAVSVGVALVTGALLRLAPRVRPGLTAGAYAQAFLFLAVLRTVQGAWLLLTGRSWGRYSHLVLPRSASVYDFVNAALLGAVAWGCWLAHRRAASRHGRPVGRTY